MGYDAHVVEVVIASPSDVPTEREIIRSVVGEWNAVNARDRRLVLMPVSWETHGSPKMGDRPQALINRQVVRDADLLIAVFWTRLGTPTGRAASGTVEEIENHLNAGKPAMIYFSSAPVRPESLDPEQYRLLRDFKDSCKQRGLIEEYDDLDGFREKLSRNLAQTAIQEFGSAPASPESGEAPPLSEAASQLLIEASDDPNGIIMRTESLDGSSVQTKGREFVEEGSARSAARWRSAVDKLLELGLIEDRAGRGEVFFMTDAGYKLAEVLRSEPA